MGCRSAFPSLKELELRDLATFQRLEADEGSTSEQITTFPLLEKLFIDKCPELTTLPNAPKLNELIIYRGSQHICQHAARYIASLSTLRMSLDGTACHCLIKQEDDKETCWSRESSLRGIILRRCDFWFSDSSAPTIWNCLVRLEDLYINDSNILVQWPEDVFRHFVSLRRLEICSCKKLTGCTKAFEQGTPGQSVLPPRLEYLEVSFCDALVEVPVLPASLAELHIYVYNQLESIIVRKQQQTTAVLGSSDSTFLTRQEKSALIGGSRTEVEAIPNDSPGISARYAVAKVRIAYMRVNDCSNLRSLSVQVDCTKLHIWSCSRLESVDDLAPLEDLHIWYCSSLASIPEVPEAYNSLRDLKIRGCPSLKVLPPCLKQRLNDVELRTDLDDYYTGPKLSRPSTWKYAITRHC